jgi:hypothetical protein
MTTLSALLTRGYFPKELPPPFYTDDFSNKVVSNLSTLPSSFTSPRDPQTAKSINHSWMRVGKLRRQLNLPNPIFYFGLCREIENNWTTIDQIVQQSSVSKSTPIPGPVQGRAVITRNSHKELLDFRVRVRANSRYILNTDISRFYPSIYTHSIAWAIHSKAIAKSQKNNHALLGNALDKWVRNGQDGQTMGIPIGPDTSLVIAEILLTDVDKTLMGYFPKLNGFRHVDDYELGFFTLSEAEEALAVLQEALRGYELDLGPGKTQIREAPVPLESEWTPFLRDFKIRATGVGQRSDLSHYFDQAFKYAMGSDRDSVLNYALARFGYFNCDQVNWPFLQNLLFQCLTVEPSTLLKVFSILFDFRAKGFAIDQNIFDEILNFIICNHSLLGHSSEVAWSLWALIVFNIPLSPEAARNVSKMNDSIIALLALDAQQRGLITFGLDLTNWSAYMDTDELYGEHWLLSYEANKKGWLPSINGQDHVMIDPNFSLLKNLGVEFYNSSRVLSAKPTFTSPSNQTTPLFSLP